MKRLGVIAGTLAVAVTVVITSASAGGRTTASAKVSSFAAMNTIALGYHVGSGGSMCVPSGAEVVATDKTDYAPGSTATISGTGFHSFCGVTVAITRPDGVLETIAASTDAAGGFAAEYPLPPPPGVIGAYRLDVLGLDGMTLAKNEFTDSLNPFTFRTTGLPAGQYVVVGPLGYAGTGGDTPSEVAFTSPGPSTSYQYNGLVMWRLPASSQLYTVNGVSYAWTGGTGCKADLSGTCDLSVGVGPVDAVIIYKVVPSVTLAGSPSPSKVGQQVTYTATVSGSSGTPTGTVAFTDNSAAITCESGSATTLNGSGVATCKLTYSSTTGSPHSIIASYGGDTSYATKSSSAWSQTVNPLATSATGLTSSLNPSYTGDQVTYTATVTGSSGTPAGTVTFKDGTTAITCESGSSTTLNASGVATCKMTYSSTSGSPHAITAVYSGDATYAASTSGTVSQVVNTRPRQYTFQTTGLPDGQQIDLAVSDWVGSPEPPNPITFWSPGPTAGTPFQGLFHWVPTATQRVIGGATYVWVGGTACQTNLSYCTVNTTAADVNAVVAYKAVPSVTLGSSANPARVGQQITYTATVTGTTFAGTPTGTVNFTDNGAAITCESGSATTLNASGVATCKLTYASTTGSPHTILASYGGSTAYTAKDSSTVSQTVNPLLVSATSLASLANPSLTGDQVTYTATVTGSSGTPTGSVTFNDGGTSINASCETGSSTTLNASGIATCKITYTSTSGSPHAITAVYGGNVTYASSTSNTVNQVVNARSHQFTFRTTGLPSGQAIGVNLTYSGSGTPSYLPFTSPGPSSAGSAAGTVTWSLVTRDEIIGGTTYRWVGGTGCTGGTTCSFSAADADVDVVIAYKAIPSVTLASSKNPARVGEQITYTATVTGSTFAGAPTGSITFNENGAAITCESGSSTTLNASGVATCKITYATPFSSHTIQAYYGGNAGYTDGYSNGVSQAVNDAAVSATALSSSANPSIVNQQVTYTATVTGSSGAPTGTVAFKDGTTAITCESGSATTLNTSGVATCKVTYASTAGSPHAITAVYGGDVTYAASTSNTVSQVVNTPPLLESTTLLASAPNPSLVGGQVTYTATVLGSGTAPTGTLTFKDGTTSINGSCEAGSATTLNASGVATCKITYSSTLGSPHAVTAAYGGDTIYAASTSAAVSQVVNVGTAQDPLTVTGPASGTYGQSYSISTQGGSGTGALSFSTGSSTACAIDGSDPTKAKITAGTGTCSIVATKASDGTYASATSPAFTVTVAKAPLTITATSKTIIFGADSPTFAVTYSGFVAGDSSLDLSGTLTYTFAGTGATTYGPSTTTPYHAGTYSITPGGLSSADYAISFVAGTYTINRKTLATQLGFTSGPTPSPAASGDTVTFGAGMSNPSPPPPIQDTTLDVKLRQYDTLAYCEAGVTNYTVVDHGTIDLQGHVDLSFTAATPGTRYYGLTFEGADSGDYSYMPSHSLCRSLTINYAQQATLSVTGPTTGTYGQYLAITYEGGSGTGTMLYSTGLSTACSLANGSTQAWVKITAGSGDCTLTVTKAASGNYASATSAPFSVTLQKAPLTVTADSKTISYGQATPTFSVHYAGWVGTDAASSLGGALTYTFAGTGSTTYGPTTEAPTHVGTYSITPSGLSSGNYAFTYVPATFTINTASVATQIAWYNSGASPSPATVGQVVTFSGSLMAVSPPPPVNDTSLVVQLREYSSVANCTAGTSPTARDQGTIDTWGFVALHDTPSTAGTHYYRLGFAATVKGDYSYGASSSDCLLLTVNALTPQAALSVTTPSSGTYGQSYSISAQGGSGTGAVSFSVGSSTACAIDSADPTKVKITAGSGTCSITATKASDGTYASATSPAHAVTVQKAPLTVSADSRTITYGQATPSFGVEYAGFVGTESASSLTGSVAYTFSNASYGPSATPPTHAGIYAVTPGGLSSGNYAITFVAGAYTINPAQVTTTLGYGTVPVAPNPANVGEQVTFTGVLANPSPPPAITDTSLTVELRRYATADCTGSYVVADEQHIDATGAVTLHTTPSAAGTVGVKLGFAGETSGDFQYLASATSLCTQLVVNAALTPQAALEVTSPSSGAYGQSYSIVAEGGSGTGAVSFSVGSSTACAIDSADATKVKITAASGTCSITATKASDGTYASATSPARAVTVQKAPLTVSADSKTITYGQATPSFGVQYAGFVGTDSASSLTGTLAYTFSNASYGPSATPPTHAGIYAVTPGGLSSGNYAITFVAGAYTINPAGVNTTVGWYGSGMTPATAQVGQEVTFTAKVAKPFVAGQSDTIGDTNLVVELIETSAACDPLNHHGQRDAQHIDASGLVTLHYTASSTLGSHVFGLVFHQQDSGDYRYYQSSSNSCQVLTVVPAKTDQTITFTAPTGVTTDTADFNLGATASSSLAVTYTSSTTDVCTIVSGKLHVVSAGDCTVTAHQAGDATYNAAPDVTRTFTIAQGKASQTIDFTTPTAVKYGDGDSALGATATSNLAVTYASSTTSVCTIAEGKLHVVAAGDCTITASQLGNDSYKAATDVSRTFAIGTAALSVTADADPTTAAIDGFGKDYAEVDPTFTVRYAGFVNGETEAVLGGTLAFAFEGTGTTTYASSTTSPTNVGTYSVTPSGLTSSNYAISFAAGSYEIGKIDQTIGFTAPSGVKYGDLVSLTATTDSGLAVEYDSSTPTVCDLLEPIIIIDGPVVPATLGPAGPQLIIHETGDCTIVATQPGDSNYNAADPVTRTFTVGKAPLSVTADDASKSYGQANPVFTVSYVGFVYRDDASVIGGTLAFDTTATPTSPVGTYDVTPKGLTSDNYDITFVHGHLTIGKASQSITFTAPTGVKVGDGNSDLGATASSGLAVSYASSTTSVCTIVAGQLHPVSGGECTIIASQAGNDNYEAATDAEKTFAIGKASQSITFTAPTGVKYGDTNFDLGATASSNLPVTYASSTESVCTIVEGKLHPAGVGDCTINASQAGNAGYEAAAAVERTFAIGKGDQTITFGTLPDKTYGAPDFTVGATASSGLDVSFSASGNCTVAGTTVSLTAAGSCTITAAQSGDARYNAAPSVSRTFQILTLEGKAAYIGQTLIVTSGSNTTSAKVTLTASVVAAAGDITKAKATFTDDLGGAVLAKGVPVTAVPGSPTQGTANVSVTLSSGKFGAQTYLIRVALDPASGSSYDNSDQLADPDAAAFARVTVITPTGTNKATGDADLTPLAPAGSYAGGTNVHYTLGLKYNKGGSNPQGQILLTFDLGDYRYYVKSNSITSLACTVNAAVCKDLTVYTKASLYRLSGLGVTSSIDGNVTLRVDLHDGGTNNGDTIGFTVLSSKNSTLYYSNNWAYDTKAKAWRTVQQAVTATDGLAVVIN